MILKENYGNLNVLEKSFLHYIGYKDGKKVYKNMNLKGAMVSPESKVEVDPVKPHTFKHIIEILDDAYVAFIVFRLNRRQVCLITTNKKMFDNELDTNKNIILKPSVLFGRIMNDEGKPVFINSAEALKKYLSNLVTSYSVNYATQKAKWDLLVVYKDINVANKWSERDNAKKGYIPTPSEKDAYRNFILDYNVAWKKKCEQWINDHQIDAQNSEDLRKVLVQQSKIEYIKFRGNRYELADGRLPWLDARDNQYLTYAIVGEKKRGQVNYIKIAFKFRGLLPVVKKMYYSTEINPSITINDNEYQVLA